MRQGLFVFERETLHVHFVEGAEALDHATWFERIGLPGHGPAYDGLLRGRVTADPDSDRVILGIYQAAYLSNHRFARVVAAFELDEGQVVEKRLVDPY